MATERLSTSCRSIQVWGGFCTCYAQVARIVVVPDANSDTHEAEHCAPDTPSPQPESALLVSCSNAGQFGGEVESLESGLVEFDGERITQHALVRILRSTSPTYWHGPPSRLFCGELSIDPHRAAPFRLELRSSRSICWEGEVLRV
jgi:hypothetical protein